MSAQRELAARRVALRKRIDESGDPDLLALQEERDLLFQTVECGREVTAEWAELARRLAAKPDGCQCNICALSFALDWLTEERVAAVDPEAAR